MVVLIRQTYVRTSQLTQWIASLISNSIAGRQAE